MSAPAGLMSKIIERGMLPSSAVSPIRVPRAGEQHNLLDVSVIASSPPPKSKPQAAEVAEAPPRTPGKKQQLACKGGKAATSPSGISKHEVKERICECGNKLMPDSKFCRNCGSKWVDKTASMGSGPHCTGGVGPMLPPRVPTAKAKAKAKGQNRRRKAKEPEFPMLPRSPDSKLDQPRRLQLPRKLPEDNYDISDREESSDEIPMEVDRSLKHVPGWVEGFEEKATQQSDIDPGSVFGRGVPICDVDEIFPDALYRTVNTVKVMRIRGSSCRWGPDRLKGSEIREYAKKTGQRRRLSLFQRASIAAASARPAKRMRGGA